MQSWRAKRWHVRCTGYCPGLTKLLGGLDAGMCREKGPRANADEKSMFDQPRNAVEAPRKLIRIGNGAKMRVENEIATVSTQRRTVFHA